MMLILGAAVACAFETSDARIEAYAQAAVALFEPPVQSTLGRMDGSGRQLLAMRSYLRSNDRIAERWSWSQEQIDAFAKTAEYRHLLAEVRQVKERFERDNPGYTLYANTEVRSLDVQLKRWNENRSVESVASAIHRAVAKELGKPAYSAAPDSASVARLGDFLLSWRPPRAAALAAPGLSKHGQLRAIDFAVFKDGKLVAPTDLASADPIWEKQGWSAKLKRATAQTSFRGPLQSPHEPWHYEYDPRARGKAQ